MRVQAYARDIHICNLVRMKAFTALATMLADAASAHTIFQVPVSRASPDVHSSKCVNGVTLTARQTTTGYNGSVISYLPPQITLALPFALTWPHAS